MKEHKDKKWITRLRLSDVGNRNKQQFEIEVPQGAEFIGAQLDATILMMLVRGRYLQKEYLTEWRSVLRVKDGVPVDEENTRYIGSDLGEWHLFEVIT